jgi:hypothetical protein
MSEQEEKKRKEELKGRINSMLSKGIPQGFASWSFQKAKAFKEAVAAAKKAADSDRAKLDALLSAINQLETYY